MWIIYGICIQKERHDEKVWKNGLVNFLKRSYK